MYRVIYQNQDFLVVSKDYGVLCIRGRGEALNEKSLFDELKKIYPELFIVHRIDRDTSGIVIFAKNSKSHREISSMFENRKIDKRYLALVWGNVKDDIFEVRVPIKEFGSGRMGVSNDGKDAFTMFNVFRRFGNFTLVEAKPVTGRRHQIRVHLYYLGYPITGDRLYGNMKVQRNVFRMMLHSYKISFTYNNHHYEFIDSNKFLDEVQTFIEEFTGNKRNFSVS